LPPRSAPVAVLSLLAALAPAALAGAAERPGDACAPEGATADLSGGKIECSGGTWRPYAAGPGAGGPGAPAAGPAAPGASSVPAAAIFGPVGVALSTATFGGVAGPVADATAVRLPDGRVRLYAFVGPAGVQSAISSDTSGTSFTADPGRRITWAPGGQARAVALGDGRIRLFYLDAGAIKSAVSEDGLTFADEGVRISGADAGFEPGALTVVRVAGGYRGYFSNLEKPGVHAERIARTATSPDMLTWTVGPYVAGQGSSIAAGASHPFAVTDGKTIALYYNGDRGSFYGVLRSTSTDGVTFSGERAILQGGGDPDLLTLPGGTTLLYYGDKVDGGGFGVRVARTTANPVTGDGAAAKPKAKKPTKKKKKRKARKPRRG
jgi:hypothetical protein